jgi:hypothetical protein
LPDGQISHLAVQPLREKYSASAVGQINPTTPAIPSHTEGRIAIVTDVGCGMRWTRMRRRRTARTRTTKSCGPDAPTLASSLREAAQATVAKEPGHRGEHEGNR